MKKLLVIAWKEITLRFTDPIMLLLAIAVPLVIAAFINLAFGGLVLSHTIPDSKVPVGIVNRDRGGSWGNLGDIFVQATIPAPDEPALLSDPLFELFAVRQIEDETQARRLVERGKLVAALLIPPDFSEALATTESAMVKVYIDGREETRGVAFQSVVETLANMISAGEVTIRIPPHESAMGIRHPGRGHCRPGGHCGDARIQSHQSAAG
jgi:hypothetical protein